MELTEILSDVQTRQAFVFGASAAIGAVVGLAKSVIKGDIATRKDASPLEIPLLIGIPSVVGVTYLAIDGAKDPLMNSNFHEGATDVTISLIGMSAGYASGFAVYQAFDMGISKLTGQYRENWFTR